MDTATAPARLVDGYARGLLEIFRAEGDADALVDEFYRAAHAVEAAEELRETLSDPRIPVEKKTAIVVELLGPRASRPVVAGVGLVIAGGQGKHLTGVASRLAELAAASEGTVVAEVRSAAELTDEQVRRLEEALGRATGRRVEAKVVVDPDLVGGIVTKIGDTVFDGSVKSQLDELREQWG